MTVLLNKLIGLSGTHAKGNQLGNLAMEGTIFYDNVSALGVWPFIAKTEWFFQAMLLIIGGRYVTFTTLYGTRFFWVLGAVLGISACLLFYFKFQSLGSLLTGSFIELSF